MYKEIFHLKIKEARKQAMYTQQEVEKETGIKQSVLSSIETGRTEPSLEILGILIDLYGVSADWILGTGKFR